MKIKKLVSIGLVLGMGLSSVINGNAATTAAKSETKTKVKTEAGSEEISPEDVSVTWDDSHVYMDLTLGKYKTITTYGVKGYEEVPFISAHDYLDILCEGKEKITVQDGVMTVELNGGKAVIDPEADTIRFDNPARFRGFGDVDGMIVEEEEYNVITFSQKSRSVQKQSKPVIIQLKQYHMPVISYEDTVLMPFLALQNSFGSVRMSNVLAYNGKDYYNAFEANSFTLDEKHTDAKDSPYIKAIYSGPFSEKKESTQAYADYGYYAVCLLLDLTFGHKEEKNIKTFDEYFTRMNAKASMCSTDPSSAMLAEFLLFNYLFDSGHDSLFSESNVFGKAGKADLSDVGDIAEDIRKSEEGKELFLEKQKQPKDADGPDPIQDAIAGALLEKGLKIPEIAPLIVWGACMKKLRPEDYKDEQLDYAGDTAVIYFNEFKDDTSRRKPSYYLDPIKEEDAEESTFAFFYQCFEDIKKHKEVKNVVINLADNGGGSAAALIAVLGFLSGDGEVKFTNKDMMSDSYREEYYHVDTNLDGIADDEDGFGGQYEFYILCSGSAYSCGNALPYFAQQNGLAKVIGTSPGGGDCVLGSFIDAYGRCAYYSGMLKLGVDKGNGFVSNENAVKPDLNMMPSILDVGMVPWFDPEGIADAVHQYQKGITEMKYDEQEESETFSEFLISLLERIGEKKAS